MDETDVKKYVTKIPDFYKLSSKEKVVYAAYYLTNTDTSPFTVRDIEEFFGCLKIPVSRIPQILSEESKVRGGRGKFMKAKSQGYDLNGGTYASIGKILEKIPELKQLDDDLAALISLVTNSDERAILEEAMRCYQVGSNRAMIILTWITALYHIENHTLSGHLANFNNAISRHPDKKVNKLTVRNIDDFTDLKEIDLIMLLRTAGVISKSIKNMLDSRLRERNTAAHPSSVSISGPQAIAFAHDMVANVILKY